MHLNLFDSSNSRKYYLLHLDRLSPNTDYFLQVWGEAVVWTGMWSRWHQLCYVCLSILWKFSLVLDLEFWVVEWNSIPYMRKVKGYKEYLKAPSSIHYHHTSTGHLNNMNNLSMIGREGHGFARTIRDSIDIKVNTPTLNRNIGKYNLPNVWEAILANTPELQIKCHWELLLHQQVWRTSLVPPGTP